MAKSKKLEDIELGDISIEQSEFLQRCLLYVEANSDDIAEDWYDDRDRGDEVSAKVDELVQRLYSR